MALYCIIRDAERSVNHGVRLDLDVVEDTTEGVVESYNMTFMFETEGTNAYKRQAMKDQIIGYCQHILAVHSTADANIDITVSGLIGLRYPPL